MRREGAQFGATFSWLLFAVRDGGRMEYRGGECERGLRSGRGWETGKKLGASGGDGHQVSVGRHDFRSRFGEARVTLQPAVQMRGPDIEQELGAAARPTHLSLFAHALIDQLVHGRFHMSGRNTLASLPM